MDEYLDDIRTKELAYLIKKKHGNYTNLSMIADYVRSFDKTHKYFEIIGKFCDDYGFNANDIGTIENIMINPI
jgi:hypothetical protein